VCRRTGPPTEPPAPACTLTLSVDLTYLADTSPGVDVFRRIACVLQVGVHVCVCVLMCIACVLRVCVFMRTLLVCVCDGACRLRPQHAHTRARARTHTLTAVQLMLVHGDGLWLGPDCDGLLNHCDVGRQGLGTLSVSGAAGP
jgi:hypothetical protein